MRSQCRKLSRFIRLADFFVIDALLGLALGSTASLLHVVRQDEPQHAAPASRTTSMLRLASVVTDDDTQPTPLFKVDVVVDLSGWDRHKSARAAGIGAGSDGGTFSDSDADDGSDDDELLTGISFRPQPEVFKQRLEGAVFEGVKAVSTHFRLMTDPEFSLFVAPHVDECGPIGEGLDVEMMIVEDPSFQNMVESTNEHLTDVFDEVGLCLF